MATIGGAGIGTSKRGSQSQIESETNAAQASQPSRIVFVDILIAVFRLSERTSGSQRSEERAASMLILRLTRQEL
jgi:hypothetical protein